MKDFICMDYGINTHDINEYYMVQNKIWDKVNPQIEGMLCIGCLEDRMGRKLKPKDFTKCPVNDGIFGMSERMRERIYG